MSNAFSTTTVIRFARISLAGKVKNGAVADGRFVWVYLPSSAPGQVVKRPASAGATVPIDFTGQFLSAPRSKYEIAAASIGAAGLSVDGRPTHARRRQTIR